MAENNNAPVSAHLTAEDYGLTTPVASEGGVPAYSGGGSDNDYGITTPVAPEGGIPAYPGSGSNNDYGITTPVAPEGASPLIPAAQSGRLLSQCCRFSRPVLTAPFHPAMHKYGF